MSSYAKMWFGTEYKMQWIDCPLQGADVSPLGWSAEGTLLNGGGYAKHSWASHKNYVFEWRQSSARRMAQIMHNYRDGVYGRGLIHFVDPLTMDFNVLPKQWAYPALMAGEANNPFLRGTALSTVATPTNTFNLPIQGAVVPLGSLSGFRADDSVFIPRPENKVLQLWGLYTTTGNATAGVYAIPVLDNGTNGTPVRLTPTALNGGTPAEYNLAMGKGVRLCVMKTSSAAGVVNLFGLVGRLADAAGYRRYDWTGAVDNSTSTVSDSAGNAMLTNLFTNPRSAQNGSTMVEVWRNFSPNPLYAGAIMSGPHSNNLAIHTSIRVTSFPVPHPLGITTGTEGGRVIGATVSPTYLGSWFQVDSFNPEGAPERYLGMWVMVTKPGYRPVAGSRGWPTAELPANQWVWIVAGNASPAGAVTSLTIAKITGDAEEDARVYITGVHASATPITGREPFYPGITSPDPDLTARWTGTANNSPSVLEGKAVRGVTSSNSVAVQSAWTPEGQSGSSIRVIPTSDIAFASAYINPSGVLPEATFAAVVRLTAPQTGMIHGPYARGIYWSGSATPRIQAPNEAGEFPLTLVHPARSGVPVLYNGARLGGGDVWFYLPTVVNGAHPDLTPFHGSMPTVAPGSAPLTEWLGGQGNSGCRFVGSPTYIENTGVNGGQISYAASFKEVGDWQ